MSRCKIPGENFGKLIEYFTGSAMTKSDLAQINQKLCDGWIAAPGDYFGERVRLYRYVEDAVYLQLKTAGKLNHIV